MEKNENRFKEKLNYYRQSKVEKLSVIVFRTITENRELSLIKGVRVMVLKTTFNNISAISWRFSNKALKHL
jgi:hypothetical protein